MSASAPTLIVGTGLAGALVAWRFYQSGQPFRWIGRPACPAASRVAAGVINPVTGKWMTQTPGFHEFHAEAEELYRGIGRFLGTPLYRELPMRRYFRDEAERKRARRRARNPRYAGVLGPPEPPAPGPVADPHGSVPVFGAARVDLFRLLDHLHNCFHQRGLCQTAPFVYRNLERKSGLWHYKGSPANAIVFCEGTEVRHNPWFSGIPVFPSKGEILGLACPSLDLREAVLHSGRWLLPESPGRFRIGATHDESDTSPAPTQKGAEALLNSFHQITGGGQEAIPEDHLAGLRPRTPDARPVLGPHPTEPGLYLFNGLGAKGALYAPQLSEFCLRLVRDQIPPPAEFEPTRFAPGS